MELAYLWIDKYKNINSQGFNFNPKVTYSYNHDLNKPIIDNENKRHFNIFPKNINVTAIVGENGSGKSRLLEAFTVDTLHGTFYDTEQNEFSLNEHFNVLLFNENPSSNMYTNSVNINQRIREKFVLQYKSIDELNYIINNLSICFLSNIKKINSDINFAPTHIKLSFFKTIDIQDVESLYRQMIIYSNTWHDTTDRETINQNDLLVFKSIFEQKIINAVKNKDIKTYLLLREFIYRTNQRDDGIFKYFSHTREYDDSDDIKSVFEYIFKNFVKELSDENFYPIIDILKDCSKEVFDEEKIVLNFEENNSQDIEKLLANINRGFFKIEFYVKKEHESISFTDLSDGEKQLLLFFGKLHYSFRILYKDNSKKMILLIDEPDTFLHPDWQRKFFYNLFTYVKGIDIFKDIQFHFIVTSHSPFVLSDIPTKNIIFLEKEEETGKCKNVTNDISIETLGANIHTLLSHAFFMENGLIGEFAKSKINELIEYLNGSLQTTINDNQNAQYLINMIGEPILRRQLQKMLDSKRLEKVDKIDLIEQKIQELSKELDELKND